MQSRKRDSNDPANPLLEVAALTMDREYISHDPTTLRILASLTFKKGSNLSGKAIDKFDKEINVSFLLSLIASIFEVEIIPESEELDRKSIKIRDVSYSTPLVSGALYSSDRSKSRTESKGLDASARMSNRQSLDVSAEASVGLCHQNEKVESFSRETTLYNAKVTHDNTRVNWDFSPNDRGSEELAMRILTGSAFMQGDDSSGKTCIVDVGNQNAGGLTIKGSVYIRLRDIIIEDISFTDGDDSEIEHPAFETQGISEKINRNKLYQRIVKSVIKKHLKDEGMRIDGIKIEICRAFA